MGWTKTPSVDGYYWYIDLEVIKYAPRGVTVRVADEGAGVRRVYFLSGQEYILDGNFPFHQHDPYFWGPIEYAPGSPYGFQVKSDTKKERNYESMA